MQFLIQLQQLRRLRRPKVKKKDIAGLGRLFKAVMDMVLLKHCLIFHVMIESFFRYIRMTPEKFGHLLSLVKEQIEKKDTRFRKSIPAVARWQ